MHTHFKFANPWRGPAARRGASGAEFAAVLPVLAIILLGLIGALRYYYAKIGTVAAANDCAVMGSQAGAVAANMAVRADQQAYGQPFTGNLVNFDTASTMIGGCQVENHASFVGVNQTIYAYFLYPVQPYRSDWSGHAALPPPSSWP